MNTVQLECFLSVAEHLNFSRASEELKISQPAVSHQIHSLEEELGVELEMEEKVATVGELAAFIESKVN